MPVAAAAMLSDNQTKYLLIGGGVLLVGTVAYLHWQAGRAVDTVKEVSQDVGAAINPVSDENIFYQGVNALVQAFTLDADTTLGVKAYEWIHGDDIAGNPTM